MRAAAPLSVRMLHSRLTECGRKPEPLPYTSEIVMDHEQKRQEHHRLEREEKQTHARQAEEQFSKPGPTIHPLWFLVVGVALSLAALFLWMGL